MSPIVMVICGVLLTAAALIVVGRVERGPSMLDRVVALDVLVAVLIGSIALVSLWFGREDLVLVLTVLALVGFVGSVTLARFAAAEPEEERRILTPSEVAEADARERERMAVESEKGEDGRGEP
ncbi:monovalent cation/H+ antiporter complex subunit F [Ruania alba]|uniref:Multisubunit sodium/proton antiporter, MrpF subunit n=1 Tax=Ruania alba TaxID=648782 RepID=A0A1H5KQD8_9MICO|nr:monovalent cation/H+ antiporter complex subunit F [Ruania alba]SEE66920.1 multisubunit sodium/proton antiporter, MrpF subunit [Ruania alba]